VRTLNHTINLKPLLVFLIIGVSTIPFFKQTFGLYILPACMVLIYKELRISTEAFLFILIALAIEIFHNFYFDTYDILATRQAMVGITAAIFLIYYIKLDFLSIYLEILYYFSLISFVFFLLFHADNNLVTGIAHAVPDLFVKTTEKYGAEVKQINPIIYNFDSNFFDMGRNNGPFWEPTVFATMLVIAQIFNLLLNKTLFNKKGIVFTIALLTTFSTTGFMAYALLIAFYFLLSGKIRLFTKVIMVAGFAFVGLALFTNLPFLSEKIDNEIEKTDHEIDQYGGDSRLASAILDVKEWTENSTFILMGKGQSSDSRIAGPDKDVLRNCGDTALLIEWGGLFALIYIGFLFYSFFQLTRFYEIHWAFSIVFTGLILIFGFSEVYFNLPFFYCLLFFGFIIRRYYTYTQPSRPAASYPELAVH